MTDLERVELAVRRTRSRIRDGGPLTSLLDILADELLRQHLETDPPELRDLGEIPF